MVGLNKSTVDFRSLYKFARKYPVLWRSTFSLHFFKNSIWLIRDFCKGNKSSFQMSKLVMMLWIIIAFSLFPTARILFSVVSILFLALRIFLLLWEFFPPLKEFFSWCEFFGRETDFSLTNHAKHTIVEYGAYCWKQNLCRLKNSLKDGIKNV